MGSAARSAFWLAVGIAAVLTAAVLAGFVIVSVAVYFGPIEALCFGAMIGVLLWVDHAVPEVKRRRM